MSRGYRISVSERLRRNYRVEDGVCSHLEILPVLPPERMGKHVRRELVARGFEARGDKLVRVEEDGISIEIDPVTAEVKVSLAREGEIDLERNLTSLVRDREGGQEALREVARSQLQTAATAEEARVQREVTERLEKRLGDLREELDRVATRATAEALKERARELGEVEEVSENAETGELLIRVRV